MEWKVIPGYSHYEISEYGEVKKRVSSKMKKKGEKIAQQKDKGGYMRVALRNDNNEWKNLQVHRLVAFSFLGDPPTTQHEVAHNDGTRDNNHVSNLRWATKKENQADRIKHGTQNDFKGSKHPSVKLSDETIVNIRKEYTGAYGNVVKLAKKYNISHQHVSDILSYRSWSHI